MELANRPPTRAAFLVLCLIALLAAVGTGLAAPVLPFVLAETAGDAAAGARAMGWLMAVYGACAFVAAPALGRLSDVVGRRPVLLVSTAGSAIGDLLVACSRSVKVACLGRAVDGVTAGNMGAVNAWISDAVPEADRARAFGRIGALFGAGLIVGPALGAALSALGGPRAPLWAAAAMAASTALVGVIALPESARVGRTRSAAPLALAPFAGLAAALRPPRTRRLLLVAALATAAAVTVQLLTLLVAKDVLGWPAAGVSAMVLAVGVTDVAVQGLLVGPLRARLGEEALGALGLGLVAMAGAALAVAAVRPGAPLALLATFAVAAGEGIFGAAFAACLSRAAGEDAQGALQGAHQGILELTAVAAPVLGTQLYARAGGALPLALAASLALWAAVLLRRTGPRPAGPGRSVRP